MFIDDEPIILSEHALAALAEFHIERDAHLNKFERLKAEAEEEKQLSIHTFGEDWNESQFWYLDETADTLADCLLDGATPNTTIGVLSTPSVFVALKNRLRLREPHDRPKLTLFEHDSRFDVFPEFVYYDFQQPFKLPGELKGSFDRLIIDPPFLSSECQTKFAMTARWLLNPQSSKDKTDHDNATAPHVIVCTAGSVEPLVVKLYRSLDVATTTFEPQHAAGLSNNYFCYANYESAFWDWRS